MTVVWLAMIELHEADGEYHTGDDPERDHPASRNVERLGQQPDDEHARADEIDRDGAVDAEARSPGPGKEQ